MRAALAFAGALAIAAVVLTFALRASDGRDGDRATVEREVSKLARCPGEPTPRARCRSTGSGDWTCQVGGHTVEVENDHPEISIIC